MAVSKRARLSLVYLFGSVACDAGGLAIDTQSDRLDATAQSKICICYANISLWYLVSDDRSAKSIDWVGS